MGWFTSNQMQANPDKFQALAVGKRTIDKKPICNIGNTHITCEESVKLLGVEIDSLLNFDLHISNICKKASQQINVLRRIGKYLTLEGRKAIYHTFIMSNFNFCPLVWHFCNKSNTSKIEKLNYRALRFVYNDSESSYEDLLQKNSTCTLHLNRLRTMAIETFKIIHKQSPVYLEDFIQLKVSSYTFRYTNLLTIPGVRTVKYGKNSFSFMAAKVWNALPEEARRATSFNSFKTIIKSWNGFECRCAMCR